MVLGEVQDALRARGHDVRKMRDADGVYEITVMTGDRAAAEADLPIVVAELLDREANPTLTDRIRAAARSRGMTPLQLALACSDQAREEGVAPPAWVRPIIKRARDEIQAEIG